MTSIPAATNGRFTEHGVHTRSVRLMSVSLADVAEVVAPTPGGRIALLDLDYDFLEAIPEKDHELARSALTFPSIHLEPGIWEGPAALAPGGAPRGFLVVDGLLSQTSTVGNRWSVELHGPGDFICAGDPAGAISDGDVQWHVPQHTVLVPINERFLLAGTRWPALWHVIIRRVALRADRLSAHLAALQLSRVEDRLEAVLWQLADRWGRVTSDGVVVPLALTHALLGRLVAAKRPTVSVALGDLAESGAVTRLSDGSWLLRPR